MQVHVAMTKTNDIVSTEVQIGYEDREVLGEIWLVSQFKISKS